MKMRFPMLATLGLSAAAACSALATPTLTPALPAPASEARPDDAGGYKKIAEQVGPALVTVKFVMKISGAGDMGDEGRETETSGVLIEAGGLVLVSNAKMGGMASRMGMQVNPTDIKVMQGDDTEGLKGKILARDSELDLCWLQIEDDKAKDKTFPFVDIASPASATVTWGDRLLLVDRMGKFFDRAVIIDEARVGGMTRKPRPLIVPTGLPDRRSFNTLGMPMFTPEGKLVGVNILQLPGKEDMEGGGEMGEGNAAVLILPAAELVKATARGKEMAAKAPAPSEADKKDDKADKAKDGEKKDEMDKK